MDALQYAHEHMGTKTFKKKTLPVELKKHDAVLISVRANGH